MATEKVGTLHTNVRKPQFNCVPVFFSNIFVASSVMHPAQTGVMGNVCIIDKITPISHLRVFGGIHHYKSTCGELFPESLEFETQKMYSAQLIPPTTQNKTHAR
jgi:hypothetical protein